MADILRKAASGIYIAPARRIPPDLPLGLMDLLIGILYLKSTPSRTSTHSLDIAKQVLYFLPSSTAVRVWGAAFFLVGLVLLYAVFHRHQWCVSFVRIGGSALFFMWALMYLFSAIEDDRASFVGVPVFLYLSYRHSFAPVRDVTHDTRRG